MSVLVDTTVWSALLRRPNPAGPEANELRRLITLGEARILGPVRQELLSGVKDLGQFLVLRDRVRAFPDLPLREEHFERAAEFSNTCRSRGVQGSPTDFLICAAAELHGLPIFTTDSDFNYFARHLPIRRHAPP